MTHFPDANWNRIMGSKLKTTTIKTNLSNPSTNSLFLKKQKKYQAMSKSATINKHQETPLSTSFNLSVSREVSVIDLQLPVKQQQALQVKRKSIINDSVNATATVENPSATMATEEHFLASRIIGSIGHKQSQATSQLFPSPITVLENNLQDTGEMTGYPHATKSFQRANQRQFQNHFSNDHHSLGKRSMKFFSQDSGISIGGGGNGTSLGNISHNSLLIRRLRLL